MVFGEGVENVESVHIHYRRVYTELRPVWKT